MKLLLSALLLGCAIATADDYPFPGNPPVTPRWAYEPWVWEDETNTRASIEGLVAGYLSRDIPVGAVIIDSPWSPSYMSFAFDESRYPAPQEMINGFRAEGIQVVCWMAGMVNSSGTDVPIGFHPDFNFVRTQNYQVTDPDGDDLFSWWKGTGMAIDFTNPTAIDWLMGNNNANLIAMGVRGFKVDEHNAYLNTSSGLLETSPGSIHAGGAISKQEYTETYYAKVADWIRAETATTDSDGIILARPYSHQGQPGGFHCPVSKLTAGWCGDFAGDWNGFAFQISNVHTSVAAGYSAVGFEVGGFQGAAPTRDSLIRQAQYAALLPVMENGGTNGGLTEHLPWFWDSLATSTYRYFATLHHNLVHFLFHLGVEANQTGQTAVSSLDGGTMRHVLGDVFLTRAVLAGNNTQATVKFPSGQWIDWWNPSSLYQGPGPLDVTVPIHQAPLFVRAGSIIPLNVDNDVTSLGNISSAGKETILVLPRGESSLTYHRPTGDGISHEDVALSVSEGTGGSVAIASPVSRDWIFKIRCFQGPSIVTGADSWNYDASGNMLTVEKSGADFTITFDQLTGYSALTPVNLDLPPAAPSGLVAIPGDGRITLDWTDAAEEDFASYSVSRADSPGGPYTTIATGLVNSGFADEGLSNGTPYYYVVSSIDLAGNESPQCAEASATPDTGPPPFAITGLAVSSGRAYEWFPLATGENVFIDRTITYRTIPAFLAGLTALRTANDDKLIAGGEFLSFVVNRPAKVRVAYDRRLTAPAWLADFTNTGTSLSTSDSATVFRIWEKDFPAGTITLGGNAGVAASTMYAVVVSEAGWSLYQEWLYQHFGTLDETGDSAPDADPDGDGQTNLLEYALGTLPLQANASPLAVTNSPPALSFPRINDPDLVYQVRVSDDLVNWTPHWENTTGNPRSGIEMVPLGSPTRRFARVQVFFANP